MGMKSRINWDAVDWDLPDQKIAERYRYTPTHVGNMRRAIFGSSNQIRRHTFGVRFNVTDELNTAIRRAAGKSGLSFSEWMRRAAEMKLAAEEGANG